MGKILVVDDEPMIRKVVALFLSSKGYHVLTASDGAEAKVIVRSERPDVVVTDVKMPLVDGIELIRSVQRDFPGTKSILMSGGTDFGDVTVLERIRGLELSATLTKPFELDDLLRIVRNALHNAEAAEGGILPR